MPFFRHILSQVFKNCFLPNVHTLSTRKSGKKLTLIYLPRIFEFLIMQLKLFRSKKWQGKERKMNKRGGVMVVADKRKSACYIFHVNHVHLMAAFFSLPFP